MLSKKIKQSSDTIHDADLGILSFADYGDSASYSCKLTLPISSKKIDVFFDTSSKEYLPSDQQKRFLKKIVDNYGDLIENAIPLILTSIANSGFKENIIPQKNLQPVSLRVPQAEKEHFTWDITFELLSLKDIFIVVYFDRLTPLSSTIEKDERHPLIKFLLRLLNGRP